MALQLHHVFAGEGSGCGEVDDNAVVDDVSLGVSEPAVRRLPRSQAPSRDRFSDDAGIRPGDPHDAHATMPAGSRHSGNGVQIYPAGISL